MDDHRESDERRESEQAFFSIPASGWSTIGPDERADLRSLSETIAQAVDSGEGPPPNELALKMIEAANRLFVTSVGEERDLRQIITTLRTAMAVCWDMYSADETGRVSVYQHMERLRTTIDEFENDLRTLQQSHD
jgi:hypothetical protein